MRAVPAVDAGKRILVVAVAQLVEVRVRISLVPLRRLVRLPFDHAVDASAHVQHPAEAHVRRSASVDLRAGGRIPQYDRYRNFAVPDRVERYRDVRYALVPLDRIVHRVVQGRRLRRQGDVVHLVQGYGFLGGGGKGKGQKR